MSIRETKDQTTARLARRLFGQPIIQNNFRSAYVEAMIEPYLEDSGWRYSGDNWNNWDFERGSQKLEVKQSAAVQTWSFGRQTFTRPIFDIAPRKGYFVESTQRWIDAPGRFAQIYVFAWHPQKPSRPLSDANPDPVDHREPAQWCFFVVPTSRLGAGKKTISLVTIERKLCVVPVTIEALCAEVDRSMPRA